MTRLNRRNFLKLSSLAVARAMMPPMAHTPSTARAELGLAPAQSPGASAQPPVTQTSAVFARAFYTGVPIRKVPDLKAAIVARMKGDEAQPIVAELETASGSGYNKLWYQTPNGFVYSAHAQPVPYTFNTPVADAGEKGFWGEVTVPFTDPRSGPSHKAGRSRYRYYGGTVYKVVKALPSADGDGEIWYQLEDEMFAGLYFVPGKHVRQIPLSEFTAISTDVDPREKKLVVNTREQRGHAFENGREVLDFRTATGANFGEGKDFRTAPGNFVVFRKTPTQHMFGGTQGTNDYYDLPGIPWVSYFTQSGVAFHGVYWHNDFGLTRSHGCINCRSDIAKWIWRWTLPPNDYATRYNLIAKRDQGTAVSVTWG